MPPTRRRSSRTSVRRVSARQGVPKDVLIELSPRHDKACMFCGRKEISEKLYGQLYQLNDVIVHYFCILLSSQAIQRGQDNEGIWGFLLNDIKSEIERGSKAVCIYCKKVGATISCCSSKCRKIFHLPCGMEHGSMHQFYQTFKSFCQQHRITQTVDLQELQKSACVQCAICKEDVKPTPLPSSLWAPCCKRNAWFHRRCIQELALSAGYFFKCPLCNNVDIFKARMLTLGIYIPSRDASWETVPNAYAELLERHSTCNADTCLCPHPQKRNYQQETGSWEIILCYTCGSSGTHTLCSSIKCDQPWYCSSCQSITEGPREAKRRRLDDSIVFSNGISQNEEKHLGESIRLNANTDTTTHKESEEILTTSQPLDTSIIVIDSSDEDDDVQLVGYVDPPKMVSRLPSSQLPVISSYISMSNNLPVANGFDHEFSSFHQTKNDSYVFSESIDLTVDDDD
ncbi:PHD finger protein 7-like isoform X2 [Daktulosphaira vitifoliae]|uniref:PHD finger protein 7-like isoform X2 n=1 Tax=Daktulosphaira vitifoliae TaxID=58002 RepID=UPI0021AA6097|nr:PHD finger protein 7-like isoform X2 [Daktulosphaira vitifoliae]